MSLRVEADPLQALHLARHARDRFVTIVGVMVADGRCHLERVAFEFPLLDLIQLPTRAERTNELHRKINDQKRRSVSEPQIEAGNSPTGPCMLPPFLSAHRRHGPMRRRHEADGQGCVHDDWSSLQILYLIMLIIFSWNR